MNENSFSENENKLPNTRNGQNKESEKEHKELDNGNEDYNEDYDEEDEEGEDYDEDEEYTEESEEDDTSEMDPEAELLYRSYEILSGFYKTHFVDLRVLDTTCEPTEVPPPTIMHGHIKEYKTTENILVPGSHYHEVIYECDPGYKLTDQGLGHMFCQQNGWMGIEPYCEEDPDDASSRNSSRIKEMEEISEEERCENDQGCDHMCRMIDDVPTCVCKEGYRLEDVTLCVDIDECLVNNGDCQHECVNKPGTYTCTCPSGYMVDGIRCIDTNECTSNNGHGPCQDICVNTEGGFQCSCEDIPGTKLDTDGMNCIEIDLCQENNGGCSHECLTSYGQSFCMCPEGYKLDVDYKTCMDTDECESMERILESCGPNAGCINTEGSFECIDLTDDNNDDDMKDQDNVIKSRDTFNKSKEINDIDTFGLTNGNRSILCSEGYRFHDEYGICVDVDECQSTMNTCGAEGICKNKEPGYQCECSEGFEFDGITCSDIDECSNNKQESRCDENAVCINTIGSFTCECLEGFELTTSDVAKSSICIDIDECKENSNVCGAKSETVSCRNTVGSYVCECKEGFRSTNHQKGDDVEGTCVDIDECKEGRVCKGIKRRRGNLKNK